MNIPRPTVRETLGRLSDEVGTWPGVQATKHRFGGTEFRLARGEIGHIHEGGLLDLPFPRGLRDQLVATGKAAPHHIMPDTGWVSYRLRGEDDLPGALALLRLNYERRDGQRGRGGEPPSSAKA